MLKITATVLLGAGLMMPLATQASDDHRYYDSEHKDYHRWNAAEDRAWHRYWEEQHHAAIEWRRTNAAQQRACWRWRHEHSDRVLWSDRH